jgi:hypothetical protein
MRAQMSHRKPTYQDVNLILDLFVMRRDERLREARDWFLHRFYVSTFEEFQALCPPGSETNASFRMMVSYWDMAASMIVAGVLEPHLFFRSSRELLMVWERLRPVLPAIREANHDPRAWHNLETVAQSFIAWLNEISPAAYEQWAAAVKQRAS